MRPALLLTTFALGVYSVDILPESERLDLIRRGSFSDDGHGAATNTVAQPACSGQPIAATDLLSGAARSPTSAYLRVWPDGALERSRIIAAGSTAISSNGCRSMPQRRVWSG